MPYLDRPGGTIFFDDTGGGGCPVITTHGFIENGTYWSRSGVTDALVDNGYRVVSMDLRGHGRSFPCDIAPDYSVEAVIGDISALADALGFDSFHLLNHATGGIAGLRFAMTHHRRLRSLIATNTLSATLPVLDYANPEWDDKKIPALADSPEIQRLEPAAIPLRSGKSFNQIVADLRADPDGHALSAFFRGFPGNKDPERCWRVVEQVYATNNPVLCADFAEGFFLDPDPQVQGLRQIGCPSLVLVGEYDKFLIKFCEQQARNIPGSTLVVLDRVGHMTAIEDPERTTAAIVEFLNRN